ncbi:MAG: hypothetical protein BRD46_04730, partial [Bacteroidetes bacterium QS_8_68_15]
MICKGPLPSVRALTPFGARNDNNSNRSRLDDIGHAVPNALALEGIRDVGKTQSCETRNTTYAPVNASGPIVERTSALVLMPALALVLALAVRPARAQQQRQQPAGADTTSTQQVEIVAADSLAKTTGDENGGAQQRTLIGDVRLHQGTTRLRADRATQLLGEDRIRFTGDVLITDEDDSLWADRVRYDSRRKISRATGDVRVSSGGEVLLAGPVGRYFFDEKRALFPERVTLVDSARVLKSRGGTYLSEAERAEFYRRVRVYSDSTYLEADSVTYRRDSEVSEARGDVFIERRGNRASSAGEQERGSGGEEQQGLDRSVADPRDPARLDTGARPVDTASARARRPSLLGRPLPVDTTRRALLPDTTARTMLWGEYAYNDPQGGYSRVTGRALLVRLHPPEEDSAETTSADTTGGSSGSRPRAPAAPDTLVVRAYQLETARSDTLRRLTATDSVRLWQTDLQAAADSAIYDRWPAAAGDRAIRDSTPRDSTTGAQRAQQRQESRFFGAPLSWSTDAQLSGDSLRVVGRGGDVRRLYARGNAFLAQEDSVLDGRLQQLKGRRMRGYFARDTSGETTLRRLWAGPNARAIYFQKKDGGAAASDSAGRGSSGSSGALGGAVRVSSDSIVFRMQAGELERMRVLGGVEGTRYKAENVPDPFRLDGLVWAPERRPRKGV